MLMKIVAHCGTINFTTVQALEGAGQLHELSRVIIRNAKELHHFHGNALLVLRHDFGVDHTHIMKYSRHVEFELFLKVVEELTEGKVALLHLPPLRPQGH